jgi:hypothetical protein
MANFGTDISRSAFFDCLHGIFRPYMPVELTAEADVEAHLAVTAFHAKENYGNRGALRKEKANPQFTKQKTTSIIRFYGSNIGSEGLRRS